MTSWTKIYESNNLAKVNLLKAFLQDEHQIDAVVMNKKDSSYLFGLGELYVHPSQATSAKFLVENESGIEQ